MRGDPLCRGEPQQWRSIIAMESCWQKPIVYPTPFEPGASWPVNVMAIGLDCGARAAGILNRLPATSMALALGKSSIQAKSQLEE